MVTPERCGAYNFFRYKKILKNLILIDILIYEKSTTCFSDEWNLLFKLCSYTERAESNKCAHNEETNQTGLKVQN